MGGSTSRSSLVRRGKRDRRREWYGRGQDGLTLPWFGRVWLNPPYSDYAGQAAAWAGRLLREYVIGNVEQACMLVNMSVAYQPAFQAIAGVATAALCIVNHRIAFVPGGGGQGARPSQSNVIYYVGPHVAGFAAVFRRIGAVLAPVAVAERAAAVAPVQPGCSGWRRDRAAVVAGCVRAGAGGAGGLGAGR